MFIGYSIRDFVCIAMFIFLALPGYSQVKDWGDISKEQLQMDVYPSDSSAAAVVLFDRAEVDFNNNLEYEMERHVRIKIIREEGYEWATAELFYNEEADQNIRKIRGHTFVLNQQGKIKKYELDGDAIFEDETSDNYKRIKFTLPSLKPGAIVEYKYRKHIGAPYYLPDWEFQKSIPVAWSEYNVRIPNWFVYNKLFVGLQALDINEIEPFSERLNFTVKSRSGGGFTPTKTRFRNRSIDIRGSENRWVMQDLPAVKKLPFMTSTKDYKSKLWIQLTEINIPNQRRNSFLKTWASVAEELMKADKFGGQLKSRSDITSAVREMTADANNEIEKLQAVYNFMIESMVWDGSYSIFTDEDIDDVLEMKKGTGAELNLLLVQLLREAGLEANPVLLSTRNHGKVVDIFAIANQFNHVICKVDAGTDTYLLDATSENDFIDILPANDLNKKGLLVSKDKTEWIDISPKTDTKSTIVINANISNEGKIKGKLYAISEGYSAAESQLAVDKMGRDNFVNEGIFRGFNEVKIGSFQVEDESSGISEFNSEINFSDLRSSGIQLSDNYMYFNPMLFLREDDNPFPQPERTIPVDFPYPYEKKYVATFIIPEGYTIEEIPKPIRLSIPGGAAKISRLTQVVGNRISLVSKLSITRTTFKPEEYESLREFYRLVVDAHNEQIVLKEEQPTAESGLKNNDQGTLQD